MSSILAYIYAHLKELYIAFILVVMLSFFGTFLTSVYRNRDKINFYSLLIRENGRISKVGVSFIFILVLLVYQVVTDTEISTYLVELLGVIFAAELGKQFVDGRTLSNKDFESIKRKLSRKTSRGETSKSAREIDDIDFDNL